MGSMPGKEEEGGTDAVADTANRKIQLMVDPPNYDNSSKLKSLKKALKICEYCIVHLKERFKGMFCTLFKPLPLNIWKRQYFYICNIYFVYGLYID